MDFSNLGFLTSVLVCVAALGMDQLLGEPRRWHPLVGFGKVANVLEARLNRGGRFGVLWGGLAVAVLVVPLTLLAVWAQVRLLWPLLLAAQCVVLWLALSLRGLAEHGRAVSVALRQNYLAGARVQVGRIVSRQVEQL
ncbi:MAG: cobalamin biosynthesis protein, partial [Natronospirillum sp.]